MNRWTTSSSAYSDRKVKPRSRGLRREDRANEGRAPGYSTVRTAAGLSMFGRGRLLWACGSGLEALYYFILVSWMTPQYDSGRNEVVPGTVRKEATFFYAGRN